MVDIPVFPLSDKRCSGESLELDLLLRSHHLWVVLHAQPGPGCSQWVRNTRLSKCSVFMADVPVLDINYSLFVPEIYPMINLFIS